MLSIPEVLLGLLTARAIAQSSPVQLCTTEICDNCPNAVTSTGETNGECVVYDRETVLGGAAGEYEPILSGRRNIWFDITPPEDVTCRHVIRSPSSITDPNCGKTVAAPSRDRCLKIITESTFNVQTCCGDENCNAIGGRAGSSSLVLRDADGHLIVPHSVGGGTTMNSFLEKHGLDPSDTIAVHGSSGALVFKKKSVPENSLDKRDCDKFTPMGGTFTSAASNSDIVSEDFCWDIQPEVKFSKSVTVTRSTTFEAGINWEILSAGVSFTVEESVTDTRETTLKVPEGQCGHFAFTAFLTCQTGTITKCENGDLTGDVCTPKRLDDGHLAGEYSFVQT